MDRNRRLVSLTVLALAATMALNGCKKSEAPQANNPQQPAAAQDPDGEKRENEPAHQAARFLE